MCSPTAVARAPSRAASAAPGASAWMRTRLTSASSAAPMRAATDVSSGRPGPRLVCSSAGVRATAAGWVGDASAGSPGGGPGKSSDGCGTSPVVDHARIPSSTRPQMATTCASSGSASAAAGA